MDVHPAPDLADCRRDVSFEAVALPCLDAVHRFARSLTRGADEPEADADDLVQETFLRAYRGWHTFQPGADCRRWLFAICHHAFLRIRARNRLQRLDDGDPDALDTVLLHAQLLRDGTDELLHRLLLGPALREALARLTDPYRSAVLLVDSEGYSYEEAAAVLDIPVGTVRSRLFRGRRLLQEMLLAHARDAGLACPTPVPSSHD